MRTDRCGKLHIPGGAQPISQRTGKGVCQIVEDIVDEHQPDHQFLRLGAYLVDLPGYGYARVSKAEKERWGRLMESYFQDEAGLITLGVQIVDIRHKPTADDVTMHSWFRDSGCRSVIVANKLDKLKKSQIEPALALIRETLELEPQEVLIPFSAEKGAGREELIRVLAEAD